MMLYFYAVVLFLFSSCMTNQGLSTKTSSDENVFNLSKISVGMSQCEVLRWMRQPYRSEVFTFGDETYDVWFYITRPTVLGQSRMVPQNLTPLTFKNGLLIGWGFAYYHFLVNKEAAIENPKAPTGNKKEEDEGLEKALQMPPSPQNPPRPVQPQNKTPPPAPKGVPKPMQPQKKTAPTQPLPPPSKSDQGKPKPQQPKAPSPQGGMPSSPQKLTPIRPEPLSQPPTNTPPSLNIPPLKSPPSSTPEVKPAPPAPKPPAPQKPPSKTGGELSMSSSPQPPPKPKTPPPKKPPVDDEDEEMLDDASDQNFNQT
jgi:outer membrane protein assembly factor BamE (lipoprotein component of BamABCDE complex)